PATVAQEVADRLVEAGVSSILNFAPTVISVPDHVALRKVDLSIELQILSFYHQRSVSSAALTVELTADLGADIAVQAG
ncbi:MAG: redox-sensing transcriptional repressor, partial [Acidimicrobiaceae bacterium]|nr:redox-sensing transcriptional repressor [Acidimicrobiaceae bacterium]